jgi:hypothetical protein
MKKGILPRMFCVLALAVAVAPFLFRLSFLSANTPREALTINVFLKLGTTAWLAFAGFAVLKRSLGFYRIR